MHNKKIKFITMILSSIFFIILSIIELDLTVYGIDRIFTKLISITLLTVAIIILVLACDLIFNTKNNSNTNNLD